MNSSLENQTPEPAVCEKTLRVLKFGGSSVGRADSIRRVADVIRRTRDRHRPVVVVSALAEVTNTLELLLGTGSVDRTTLLLGIYRRHVETARELLSSGELKNYRFVLGQQLSSIIPSLRRLRQNIHTRFDRERVLAAGERFSVPLIAAVLRDAGIPADAVDGISLIHVDGADGSVDYAQTNGRIQGWFSGLDEECVPIVTGFIGVSECGNTITLGRGGSDFTAALIAAALGAELMERWTDVDGLFDGDPRIEAGASPYRVLRMDEAEILNKAARLGMHRHTLTPLIASRVPLRVRSLASGGPGTLVIPTTTEEPGERMRAFAV